jgi:nitroreductase
MTPLESLRQRQSTPSRLLTEPAPDDQQLLQMLEIAARVPDHGVLVPFRFIRIAGAARERLSAQCEQLLLQDHPDADDSKRQKERGRFTRSPLCIVVVAHFQDGKIPPVEQHLSAGCAAMNLLHAAWAMGFGAQWLTGWPAYHPQFLRALGLSANERVVGFVYLGTASGEIPPRPRPDVLSLLSAI